MARRKDQQSPEPETFKHFLTLLGPDEQIAGAAYERLRQKLISFFRWKVPESEVEDLADRALDRTISVVFRKSEITTPEAAMAFTSGVARFLLLEHLRARTASPLEFDPPAPSVDEENPIERLQRSCLETAVTPEERDLLRLYYQQEGRVKMQSRRDAADTLCKSQGALRIQVMRIRRKLKKCVEQKLLSISQGNSSGSFFNINKNSL